MNTKPRIAFLGDLTADIYLPQKDIRLGGAALNMAIWAKRSGAEPTILSAVGTDTAGKAFVKKIHEEKFNVKGIQRKRGRTSEIEIFISETGERRYGKWSPGVLGHYNLRRIDRTMLEKLDALAVTIYPPFLHVLGKLNTFQHVPFTIINFGDLHEFHDDVRIVEENLDSADALIFGLDKDADEQRINAIRRIARWYNKLTIVTLGKYGSVAWHNGESFVQPACDVNVVDTTGAGDSFLAAFLVYYLKTQDVQKSLAYGSSTVARVIQKVGAY